MDWNASAKAKTPMTKTIKKTFMSKKHSVISRINQLNLGTALSQSKNLIQTKIAAQLCTRQKD